MEITTDAKIGIGVLLATVIIIGGAAFFANRNQSAGKSNIVPVEQSRLLREGGPSTGYSDAQITVVEFGDFQCPACGAVHPIMKQLRQEYTDASIRFVFRHFPLPQHQYAALAAQAAETAHAQGKFWEYHDMLFENQQSLNREDLEHYAQTVGLDVEAFKKALDENTYKDTVQQDVSTGRSVGIQGTPTIFINGVPYEGQYTLEGFQAVINSALQNKAQ